MKKFIAVLAIAGVLVSCDNSADSAKRTADSTDSAKKADSIKALTPPAMDTTHVDTMHMPVDTTHKMGDTSKMKMK